VGLLMAMHAVATPAVCQMDATMAQVKTMLTISMKSNASVGDVAHVTGVGLPAASATLDRLVQQGLVDRSEDPTDRRRTLVSLTDEGRQMVETVWRLRRDLLNDWVSRLDGDDLQALSQGIAALRRVAEQETTQPATVAV
jgi:DNA-binding MarR family transcriptional regulator